jgi:hypothetical protein
MAMVSTQQHSFGSLLRVVALLIVVMVNLCQAADLTYDELQLAYQAEKAKSESKDLEITELQKKLNSVSQLIQNHSEEASLFRQKYESLCGVLDGLGVTVLQDSLNSVQDRLLSALSDLRLAEESRQKLDALLQETNLFLQELANSDGINDTNKEIVQLAINKIQSGLVGSSLRVAPASAADLQSVRVISAKTESGIVVISAGLADGVKPGMPFVINRGDRPIAKIIVAETRDYISGAIVQDLVNKEDPILVGDQGKVDINPS